MSKPSGEMTFERALAELEKIVHSMDSGEFRSSRRSPRTSAGLGTGRFCQQRLEAASATVKVLEARFLKPLAAAQN